MRTRFLVVATTVIALSCSGGSGPTASKSPSPSAAPSASPAASPTPDLSGSSYGLYLAGTRLDMIDTNAQTAASAPVAPPSVRSCGAGMGAVLQPPVSATADKVFFRYGDAKIRSLVLPAAGSPRLGQIEDVTTVPGGPSQVSFFSVSPDGKRIAVVVEDLSPAATINIRLYVEDLRGGGHHADIYTTSTPKKGGSTLWPMGWHRGNLVLAVIAACTPPNGAVRIGPTEWHVSTATKGARLVTISPRGCVLSLWPSPAGVACVNSTTHVAYLYDWTGKLKRSVPTHDSDIQSSLSPSGRSILFSNRAGIGALPTDLLPHDASETSRALGAGNAETPIPSNIACLWIDEDHILGPQHVIGFPSGLATLLAGEPTIPSGVCAGRFPGGL
jgi:hypothetical protein